MTRIIQIEGELQLIAGCKRFDERAMKLLYERYALRMMGVCLRYMRERNDAEDVLQEGFVKVFRHLKEFRGDGSLEGWIRRIMVTTALTALKKTKRIHEKTEPILVSHDQEVEPSVLNDLSIDELMSEIANLPVGYRTVLNLFAIEGYTHVEIGKMLGINESTSRSQYARARKLLVEKMLKKETFQYHGSGERNEL